MPYADVDDLKARLKRSDYYDDPGLTTLLVSASEAIDRFCKRAKLSPHVDSNGLGFLADATANTREYVGSGGAIQRIDECTAISLVEVKASPTDADYEEWDDSDWIAATGGLKRVIYSRLPYTLLVASPSGSESYFTLGRQIPTVRVTAMWGYAVTTPPTIREATIMQTIRWFNRMKAGMADTLASSELGALMITRQLDPDIEQILFGGGWVRTVL